METLTEIFQLLLIYPICVYLYQAGIVQIGPNTAMKKAWDAFVAEIKLLFVPIRWLFSHNKVMKNTSREKSVID